MTFCGITVMLLLFPSIIKFNRNPSMDTLFEFPMIVRFTITLPSALITKKESLQRRVTDALVIVALMFPAWAEFGYITSRVPARLRPLTVYVPLTSMFLMSFIVVCIVERTP